MIHSFCLRERGGVRMVKKYKLVDLSIDGKNFIRIEITLELQLVAIQLDLYSYL